LPDVVINPSEIALDKTSITLQKNETVQITSSFSPENVTERNIKWTSDNMDVAVVDESGNVTAINDGIANIIATTENGKTAICNIMVDTPHVHEWGEWQVSDEATVFEPMKEVRMCSGCDTTEERVSGDKLKATIKVTSTNVSMNVNETITGFEVYGLANGDSIKSITSENDKVANVSDIKSNGTFKIIAKNEPGITTINIELASGLIQTVEIEVKKVNENTVDISGIPNKLSIKKGASMDLKKYISNTASNNTKITYKSSDKKIVSISQNGIITAKKAGTAKITIKVGTQKVVCNVTVKKIKTTKITGVKTKIKLKKGKKISLKPKLTPINSDDKITYTTSNKKVATVSKSGVIKAKKNGIAVITIKSGNKKIKCRLVVS
jgi:uncharacterized protein YjdB